MEREHPKDCDCCRMGREAFLVQTEEHVRKFGQSIITTKGESNGHTVTFSYTVGLADVGLPEVIVFGLPGDVACSILNDVAAHARAGTLRFDAPMDNFCNLPVVLKQVAAPLVADYIIQANARAGRDLPAVQLVWPDAQGKFPWEDGADARMAAKQPVLSTQLN